MIDGLPIVVIATDYSLNPKTGDMIQAWILPSDEDPHTAVKSGRDRSVCGDCRHRPANGNTCYVVTFQAPLGVHRAYKRGRYKPGPVPTHKPVRMGAWGDPAAAPFEVWEPLLRSRHKRTGYTHQWRTCDQRFRHLVQASCDSASEALEAASKGWRGFIVRPENPVDWLDPALNAIECLNTSHGLSCMRCGACDGTKANIFIQVHGKRAKAFA